MKKEERIINFNKSLSSLLAEMKESFLGELGINTFGYTCYRKDGRRIIIEDSLEWLSQYQELGFYEDLNDNHSIVHNIKTTPLKGSKYYLLAGQPETKTHCSLFNLNMWPGISLYFKEEDSAEVFHFSTAHSYESINKIINNLSFLNDFVSVFKKELTCFSENLRSLPVLQGHASDALLLFSQGEGDTEKPLTASEKLKKQKIYLSNYNTSLTRREIETLFYLSLGNSAKEIGRLLGISSRTVEAYLCHIKVKTNLNKRNELVNLFLKNRSLFEALVKE